ncbi:MAG TPA: tetratricopeptide repeat protein, partial [Burkholderiales bacterium]
RAATVHPQSADAWNNLAQTLLERGRKDEALRAVEHAVQIGGPRIAIYRSTRDAILKKMM